MLYLTRSGPETMALEFESEEKFGRAEEILTRWGIFVGDSPNDAADVSGEHIRLIVAITLGDEPKTRVYVSGNSHARFFCMLLNAKAGDCISRGRMEPGYLIVRLIGDIERGIENIRRDYGGEFIPREPFFRETLPEDSTIIYFTREPLNRPIPQRAMYEKALFVTKHSKEMLLTTLRQQQNEYLNDSTGTPDWNSMEIQIGDKEGRFSAHRQRVWTAIQGLQLGSIMEEGWRKEYTLVGKLVNVYVLTLFTPFDAEKIKGWLTGLEYGENGERLADLDLFFKGAKISWKERGKDGGLSKTRLGLEARHRMLAALDRHSLIRMKEHDAELNEAK